MSEFHHITVLKKETIDALKVKANGKYVDATFGGGGHARYLISQLNQEGKLFGFDQDQMAIQNAQKVFKKELESGQLTLIHKNFREMKATLKAMEISSVDGIYFDLGVSSPQFDQAERGFSYQLEAPLDMRMDQTQPLNAQVIVNNWSEKELQEIFFKYGEERFSKRIAHHIVERRKEKSIRTTIELSDLIKEAIPAAARRKGGHPAKRVFQAIRIAVNDELGALEETLDQALALLSPGGRLAVITFQSLEDRLVKYKFKEVSEVKALPKELPLIASELPQADFRLVNRKAITSTKIELEENRRAHSAKLRVIERIKKS